MIVPFVDLKKQHKILGKNIRKAIGSIIDKGNFIMGDDLAEFEKQFAEYIGCKYAVGVGSGTGALHLALLSNGIGPGDEGVIGKRWRSSQHSASYGDCCDIAHHNIPLCDRCRSTPCREYVGHPGTSTYDDCADTFVPRTVAYLPRPSSGLR